MTEGTLFGVLISALAKDADASVLSTPTIVTLDNVEASFIVGQVVPDDIRTTVLHPGRARCLIDVRAAYPGVAAQRRLNHLDDRHCGPRFAAGFHRPDRR